MFDNSFLSNWIKKYINLNCFPYRVIVMIFEESPHQFYIINYYTIGPSFHYIAYIYYRLSGLLDLKSSILRKVCKISLGGPGGDHVNLLPGRAGHYRLYNSEWVSDSCSAIVQLYHGDCIIINNVKLMWTFFQYHYILKVQYCICWIENQDNVR
jgi:hypothetical protein